MYVPTVIQAEQYLSQAEQLFPGLWIKHNRIAGQCAREITQKCPDLDVDTSYVLGLLHDIGRRFGVSDMKHILEQIFMNWLELNNDCQS